MFWLWKNEESLNLLVNAHAHVDLSTHADEECKIIISSIILPVYADEPLHKFLNEERLNIVKKMGVW